jgi:hypothetical protein
MDNSLLPGALMLSLSLVCVMLILLGLRKALKMTGWEKARQRSFFVRTLFIIIGWMVLLAVLSMRGFFRNFDLPPRVVFSMLLPVIAILIFSFTRKGKQLIRVVPAHWLIIFQSFRIFVELLLWLAFMKGLLPEQMTFEGMNYDVLAGIFGLVAGWLVLQYKGMYKKIVIVYNVIGLGLLLNILVIAILSFPGPGRYFMNEPANRIVAEFPFIYLPGILVVIAAGLHILSLRRLFIRQA